MIKGKSVNALNNTHKKNRSLFLFGARLHYYYEASVASHSCTDRNSIQPTNSSTLSDRPGLIMNCMNGKTFIEPHKTDRNTPKSSSRFKQHEDVNLTGLQDLSGFFDVANINAFRVSITSRRMIKMLIKKTSISIKTLSLSCRGTRHLSHIEEQNYFRFCSAMFCQYTSATQQTMPQRTPPGHKRKIKASRAGKARHQKNIFNYTRQLSFVIVLLLFLISSCKKPDITFGPQFLNNSNTQVVYVDTMMTEMTTVFIDSFKTSGIEGSVAGIYSDPYFGIAKAKSYLQIAPPSYNDSFSNAIFDSLELLLHLNKTYYGDTTKPLTLQVSRLTQNIKPASGTSYIFSNDSFAVYTSPLAQKIFTLQPNKNDSILHIRLPDELGIEWLNMLASSADAIKSSDAFVNYFKGLCIAPSGLPAFMLGFTDSVVARLHYKTKSVFLTEKQVDFSLYNKDYQFENISVDRTGTALSNISISNDEINTSLTNNAGYLQGITGTVVKFRFPYLRSMLQTSGYVQLVNAELKVKPVNGTFGGLYPLPPALILSSTDKSNKIGTALSDASGNIQSGSLQIDELYGNTYYSYDITSYLKSLLSISTNNSYGLIISPATPEFETTFNRVLIGDNKNKISQTQLNLYYLAVQ